MANSFSKLNSLYFFAKKNAFIEHQSLGSILAHRGVRNV